jgi:hypothetical protein
MFDELAELRRTNLRTVPDRPHFELLLDAVRVARDVGEEPTQSRGNAAGLALGSVARWATNVQAFSILVKAELWTERSVRREPLSWPTSMEPRGTAS